MTDEEKAEEYVENKYHCNRSECIQGNSCDYCYREGSKRDYLAGLAEGRKEGYEQGYEDCRHYAHDYYKPKWHDLRKNPNDLPKESNKYLCTWEGGEQWIMDFETEVNSFGYWCNIFDNQSLGFVDSEFETIKERGEDEPIAWCELPKFEE